MLTHEQAEEIAALRREAGKVYYAVNRLRMYTGLGLKDAYNFLQNVEWEQRLQELVTKNVEKCPHCQGTGFVERSAKS